MNVNTGVPYVVSSLAVQDYNVEGTVVPSSPKRDSGSSRRLKKKKPSGSTEDTLLLELQDGLYMGTRDFLASLRFKSSEIRGVSFDRIARGFKRGRRKPQAAVLETVSQWATQEPNNKDALLLHGMILVICALSSVKKEELFDTFTYQLQKAQQGLQEAINIDPTDPLPYVSMITATRELSELKATFAKFQLHCKDPLNLAVHQAMLYRLAPHWGGSAKELLEFARHSTTQADTPPPLGHPLWSLLAKAHLIIWEDQTKTLTVIEASKYWKDMTTRKEIVKSYRKYRKETLQDITLSMETDTECTNLFAFVLYKCKAYKDAYPEFQTIGDMPSIPEPWNKEDGGGAQQQNCGQSYNRALGKVMAKLFPDYETHHRKDKKGMDDDTSHTNTSTRSGGDFIV